MDKIELDRRYANHIEYSADLQRIIEDLCRGGPIREPRTTARFHYDMAVAYLASIATTSEPVAWLGEGDGFKTFTRRKSVANMWATGDVKVTPVFEAPPAAPTAIDVAIEALEQSASFLLWQFNRKGPVLDSLEAWKQLSEALASLKATRETA